MSRELSFYQQHLEKVSRSFAYCIQQMESPLREWTSLAYLLCRVLDTVEDSPWLNKEDQLHKIRRFLPLFQNNRLSDTHALSTIQEWSRGFSAQITPAEKELVSDLPRLVAEFRRFPFQVQTTLLNLIASMSGGMSHFLTKADAGSQQKISSLAELNEYCFFVAGVVGEAMTEMVAFKGSHAGFASRETILKSFHFGLFLQKVNVLKDQFKDEKEGRFFIFDRPKVIQSLREHAEQTLSYIKSIPTTERGYRVFCATSFFLGMATIPLLQMQDSSWLEPKLEKEAAVELFKEIEAIADFNTKIEELYNRYSISFDGAGSAAPNVISAFEAPELATMAQNSIDGFASQDWFFESYKGALGRNEIQL